MHPALKPILHQGAPIGFAKVDVSAYLVEPSIPELDALVAAYERACPPGSVVRYLISEIPDWDSVAQPLQLTIRGRYAHAQGMKYPFIAPVRERLRTGRAFALKLWDGKNVGGFSSEDSWSFSCDRLHIRDSGLHAAVRAVFPATVDPEIPYRFALDVANSAGFHSGHGGLSFSYNQWHKQDAFTAIYPRARRYWGIDIHDLNLTLPLMRDAIKGVGWLTMLGARFLSLPEIEGPVAALRGRDHVSLAACKHGVVIRAGLQPEAGDSNRLHPGLQPYFDVAAALKSLYVADHPDFMGEGFIQNGNTLGWIRRFIEPSGWQ
jgi:hypothetical protein